MARSDARPDRAARRDRTAPHDPDRRPTVLIAHRVHPPTKTARHTAQDALPFVVATVLILLGYLRYAPGTAHPNDYLADAWEHLRYSDVIWLYLRDDWASHPRPYLDFWFEYPVLLGGLVYLLAFAPSLAAYFALSYALLAVGHAAHLLARSRRMPVSAS